MALTVSTLEFDPMIPAIPHMAGSLTRSAGVMYR
jgi:hypothetical protein